MKKKGFTLIELLAVIVILAIIALIAVPIVMNIVTKASKSAFKNSVYGIIKAGEMYYAEQQLMLEPMIDEKEFVFPDNIEGLQIKGSLPKKGSLLITDTGEIALAISNEKYCAKKNYNEDEIVIDENLEECHIKNEPEEIKISKLEVVSTSLSLITNGTYKMEAVVEPNNATNKELEWISSDTSIVTVNANGEITGIKAGTTVVTVKTTDGSNLSQTVNVTVRQAVTSVSLSQTNVQLLVEGSKQITAAIEPSNAAVKTLKWISQDPKIATVNNGLVTAISEGYTTITSTTMDGSNITNQIMIVVMKANQNISSSNNCIRSYDDEDNLCPNGTKVNVKVNASESYDFYVINDDYDKLDLIMSKNLGSPTAWITQAEYLAAGGTSWASRSNEKGPLTALRALEERTASWSNALSFDYYISGNNYDDIIKNDVKTRMLAYYEALDLGCTVSQERLLSNGPVQPPSSNPALINCPSYLVSNISDSDNNNIGYWLSSDQTDSFLNAWAIHSGANEYLTNVGASAFGVRPIISIRKSA